MDEQLQQLAQLLTQAVQIIQQMGGGADPGMAPPDGGDPSMMMDDDGGGDMPPEAGAGVPDPDEAAKMAMRSRMMKQQGGSNLDSRIAALEQHTGLRKSARGNVPTLDRVAFLEEELLGTEYEGRLVDRLEQLEDVAGLQKSAAAIADNDDDAPDEIDLTALIKTAVQTGIAEGMARLGKSASNGGGEELPSVSQMRKAAKGQPRYGQSKRQATTVTSNDQLIKAAQGWGWTEEDLDQPVSFGDMLLAQYHANQDGHSLMGDDDD